MKKFLVRLHEFFRSCFVAVMCLLFVVAVPATLCLGFSTADPEITGTYFFDMAHTLLPLYFAGVLILLVLDVTYERTRRNLSFILLLAWLPAAITSFYARDYLEYYWIFPSIVVMSALTFVWAFFALPAGTPLVEAGKELVANRSSSNANDNEAVSNPYPAIRQKDGFNAIIGMSEVKERLRLAANEIILANQNQSAKPRNGILFYGDPGNGKTFFAQALAGETKIPLLAVSIGDISSKWVGDGTERIMAIFAAARKQAPCVLFIDEIDSLIRDRSKSMSGGSAEEAKMTNALLTEMVNIRNSSVILIAATNFQDQLDPAAIREGRFDFKIEIPPPDEEARIGLISHGMRRFPEVQLLDPALRQAAKRWEGFSVARIRAVIEEAGRQAVARRAQRVDYKDLSKALRTVQGMAGDRIPPNTPSLNELIMRRDQLAKLKGIAHRMEHIEAIEEIGGSVPTGVLFYGPPGTGKTLTVRSLAKTTGWPVKVVSGSDLLSCPDKLDQIVAFARANRPCIIFLDEADDVLADRRGAVGHGSAMTNKLLAAIDGGKGKTADVLWVAATNHPDSIDEAALRGGRFTEKIEFGAPDSDTSIQMLGDWLKKTKAPLEPSVTAAAVASILDGQTPANIVAILQQAVNQMVERRANGNHYGKVTLNDVRDAVQVVLG